MELVRFKSLDKPDYGVNGVVVHHIEHGTFDLYPNAILRELHGWLARWEGVDLDFTGFRKEHNRIVAGIDWINSQILSRDKVTVVPPTHQLAVALVADCVISEKGYHSVFCPVCRTSYPSDRIRCESLQWSQGHSITRAIRSFCKNDHTLNLGCGSIAIWM